MEETSRSTCFLDLLYLIFNCNHLLNTQKYLSDKHASHIKPHSKGGSNDPKNIKWENAKDNLVRGDKPMTSQEQIRLDAKWHFDNLTGAVKAGVKPRLWGLPSTIFVTNQRAAGSSG
ncbi:hypothetical protein [Nostoc sp.]|uniref:hypothetical protein n=1 Tax=Nostoc sp. TaxID=1180 RepID=UPI002FF01A40